MVMTHEFTEDDLERHLFRLAAEISLTFGISPDNPEFGRLGTLVVLAHERMIAGEGPQFPVQTLGDVINQAIDEEVYPHLRLVIDNDSSPDITDKLWPPDV